MCRALILALVLVSRCAVGKSVGVVRPEPDCLVEVFDGEIVCTLFLVNHAAVVVGPKVVGIELDRLVVVLDGAIVLTLCHVGVTTIVVRDDQGLRRLLARIDE
jgi:hypothetical protein